MWLRFLAQANNINSVNMNSYLHCLFLLISLFRGRKKLLERIVFENVGVSDCKLMNTIHFNPGFTHLSEIRWSFDHISLIDCTELGKLLMDPYTKFHRLELSSNELDDN